MPRRPAHLLPFRIPFFRIFYSTTYTTVYVLCLCVLAITPVSMIWQAVQQRAYQYIIMIGGTYVLTAITAILIYASRLYSNRSALAGVGKAYIPVEHGELGSAIRKMIVKQLERSALIAWESRPRDLCGEALHAQALHSEQHGMMHTNGVGVYQDVHDVHKVGREVPVDPAAPPWGDVQHAGWSSPAHRDDNTMPDVQFANVIAELPNLIEARAVSLAPPDPTMTPTEDAPTPDPAVIDALQRPNNMGMRDYLTQLSYLGLVNPPEVGQNFLLQYERARFGGFPIMEAEFNRLMSAFAELLSGMEGLDHSIIHEIRLQTTELSEGKDFADQTTNQMNQISSSPPRTPESSLISPVTARTGPSRNITPYLQQNTASVESVGSVIHQPSEEVEAPALGTERYSLDSSSLASVQSDSGSVVRHRSKSPMG